MRLKSDSVDGHTVYQELCDNVKELLTFTRKIIDEVLIEEEFCVCIGCPGNMKGICYKPRTCLLYTSPSPRDS